jgi:subtilisin family serine protease
MRWLCALIWGVLSLTKMDEAYAYVLDQRRFSNFNYFLGDDQEKTLILTSTSSPISTPLSISTPTETFSATPRQIISTPTLTPSETAQSSPIPTETSLENDTSTPTLSPTVTITPSLTSSSTWTPTSTNSNSSSSSSTPQPTASNIPDLSGSYIPGEVLIKVDPASSLSSLSTYLDSIDADITSEISELSTIKIRASGLRVEKLISELEPLPGVLYVEPNYKTEVLETIPNDPQWSELYGLEAIQAPEGWDLATGSAAVTIAILDTGVDQYHPDLGGKIVSGYDFIEMDADPQDDNGHGTHVAGIAAAVTNNGIGIAGASWGARIMPIKVLNHYGSGSYAGLAEGIVWATDQGTQVINCSLGGAYPSAILKDAIDYAYAQGVVQVAASGNSGGGYVLYPARYTNVIAVGATDANNNRAGFSNYGSELSLVAPGVSIYSTQLGAGYGYRSGTSMSTPFVSGLVAVLVGLSRPYSPDLIAYEMESTTLDLGAAGWDSYHGHGLIQMDAAINAALPTITPTASFTFTPRPTPTITSSSTASSGGHLDIPEPSNRDHPEVTLTPTPTSLLVAMGVDFIAKSTRTAIPSWKVTIIPTDSLIDLLTATYTGTPTSTVTPGASASVTAQNIETPQKTSLLILGITLILISLVLFGCSLFLTKLNQA